MIKHIFTKMVVFLKTFRAKYKLHYKKVETAYRLYDLFIEKGLDGKIDCTHEI